MKHTFHSPTLPTEKKNSHEKGYRINLVTILKCFVPRLHCIHYLNVSHEPHIQTDKTGDTLKCSIIKQPTPISQVHFPAWLAKRERLKLCYTRAILYYLIMTVSLSYPSYSRPKYSTRTVGTLTGDPLRVWRDDRRLFRRRTSIYVSASCNFRVNWLRVGIHEEVFVSFIYSKPGIRIGHWIILNFRSNGSSRTLRFTSWH